MGAYDQIKDRLWPRGPRPDIWMIVDCARDQRIFSTVSYSGLQRECLFAGQLAVPLERAAPYLLQLEYDDRATRRLIDDGFGQSWGVLIRADLGIKTLRKHLRTLLRVQGPNGKYMLFRYWDPRVLRVYLPTCMSDEVRQFFGPIEHLYVEDRAVESRMIQYSDRNGRIEQVVIPIS